MVTHSSRPVLNRVCLQIYGRLRSRRALAEFKSTLDSNTASVVSLE